jgi:hypothetical protein
MELELATEDAKINSKLIKDLSIKGKNIKLKRTYRKNIMTLYLAMISWL